jgi:cytochrome c peroxidase
MRLRSAGACAVLLAVTAAPAARAADQSAFTPPTGLHDNPIDVPADNPMTAGKIALGKQLFFDKRLSKTKTMSCETCHVPEKGWTDGLKLSPKFDGSVNVRHSPTLYGVAYYPDLYWDGRAKGLEAQILAAWKGQMGADPDAIAQEIDAIPAYKAAFEKELGGPPTGAGVVKALATFVRTIHAGDTPYDRSPGRYQAGFKVFSEVASCSLCHLPPVYSDTLFHNVGVGASADKPDQGRGKIVADAAAKASREVTPDEAKLAGAFKTPTLRGVAISGPYFHDGSVATLEAAVDSMLGGGTPNANLDEKLKAKTLTARQRKDLLAFLRALTPEAKPYPRPQLP